jgi:hypothetical protein
MSELNESVCFRIDEKFEPVYALPILSALQAYVRDAKKKTESWNKLYKDNIKHGLKLTLVSSNLSMLKFLADWLAKEKELTLVWLSDLDGHNIGEFDYYVDISLEKVMDIVSTGKIHFVQGVSILIGCAAESLADLSVGNFSVNKDSVLLADCSDLVPRDIFLDLEKSKFTNLLAIPDSDNIDVMVNSTVIDIIRCTEAVIGRRGFVTYAASCMQKPVLEFFGATRFDLLSQWSNKNYIPMCVDSGGIIPFRLEGGIKRLWEAVLSSRGSETTTGHEMFSVGSADVT